MHAELPTSAEWLGAVAVWLLLIAIHAAFVVKLLRRRPAEIANTLKVRSVWLFVLAYVNPALPFTALIVLVAVYKTYCDGERSPSAT
jgi:ABC-type xylose transport system permease subunit